MNIHLQKQFLFSLMVGAFLAPFGVHAKAPFNLHPQEKPILVFDLDDTIIYSPSIKRKIATQGIHILQPRTSYHYLKALNIVRKSRLKDENGVTYVNYQGKRVTGGGTPQMLFNGLKHPELLEHITPILSTHWQNTRLRPGALTLLNYLKTSGYNIMYATNKDHVSYEDVATSLDAQTNNQFSQLPTKVLVAEPSDELKNILKKHFGATIVLKQKRMPRDVLELAKRVISAEETPKIYHSQSEKPNADYYTRLKTITNNKPLIFFDDRTENIKGVELFPTMTGYNIKTVADIVDFLQQSGVLNPEKDATLYEQLARENVFGRLNQLKQKTRDFGNYALAKITPSTPVRTR